MKQSSHGRSCKDEPSKLVAYCGVLQYYFDEFAIGSTISMSPVKRNPWYAIKDIHRETLSIQPKTVEKATKQKCRMWFNINLGSGEAHTCPDIHIYNKNRWTFPSLHISRAVKSLHWQTYALTCVPFHRLIPYFLFIRVFWWNFCSWLCSSKRCKMCVGGHVFDT